VSWKKLLLTEIYRDTRGKAILLAQNELSMVDLAIFMIT
jgi:hypothetical protein